MNGGSISNRTPSHRQLPRMILLIHDSHQSTINSQPLGNDHGLLGWKRILVRRSLLYNAAVENFFRTTEYNLAGAYSHYLDGADRRSRASEEKAHSKDICTEDNSLYSEGS